MRTLFYRFLRPVSETLGELPIRWRLSLWYGAVLCVIVIAFGAAVYGMMRNHLTHRSDAALFDELAEVEDEARHAGTREQLQQQLERRFGDDATNEYQISDGRGVLVFRSRRLGSQSLPMPPSGEIGGDHSEPVRLHDGQQWRVASRRIPSRTGQLIAQVASSSRPDQELLGSLLRVMLVTGPLALAGALLGGYLLARRALEPVDQMVSATTEITAERLDRRLHVGAGKDEVSRLAISLNGMIDRLDNSFRDMQRFTGDAAHELRTPLAIIHSAADVALAEPHVPPECRRVFEDILEEVERLARLADQLLYLAREDSRLEVPAAESLRLDALASDVIEHLRLVAEDKGVTIDFNAPGTIMIIGDADRLRRLFLNLIDNAIKFTLPGGRVEVNLASDEAGGVSILVADSGIGIAPEHLSHIFDRFYRADPSRSSEGGGAGLGLAICKAIVQVHGGKIEATSTPGLGTCIRVQLPTVTPGSPRSPSWQRSR